MVTIGNDILQARIHPKGAELQSLYHKAYELEYMWSGDAAWWGKYSPILFPIVGQLVNDTYTWQGKDYRLPRHGFARDMVFDLASATASEVVFRLVANETTRAVYPFDFALSVTYTVHENRIRVAYQVDNTAGTELLYSIGAHPAFAVPLVPGTSYSDYFIRFEQPETAPRWLIRDGLIDQPEDLLQATQELPLTHDLFYRDALVFKQLRSHHITLGSNRTPHGLTMNIRDFPYLGIWAAKNAPFVCLEPWQGIADAVTHNGMLEAKEGMIHLDPQQSKTLGWELNCF